MRCTARICFALMALFSLAMATSDTVQAEKRVALVVGNSNYRHVGNLANPVNDAKLMAGALQALGFALVGGKEQLDLDKPGFDRVVQDFGSQLQGADVGLFFFAGHGVQVRGANYLVPVGANPTRETDVDFQMLDANLVLRQMEGAGTRLNIVILDACRNNPFAGRGLRSSSSGLVQMQAPEGTLISFATQPGNVAKDGDDGNSPYTKALAQTIRRAGLDIFQTFNEVGLAVKRSTGGAQQPWVSSSPIAGSFYFAGAPAVARHPARLHRSPVPTPAPPPLTIGAVRRRLAPRRLSGITSRGSRTVSLPVSRGAGSRRSRRSRLWPSRYRRWYRLHPRARCRWSRSVRRPTRFGGPACRPTPRSLDNSEPGARTPTCPAIRRNVSQWQDR